VDRETCSESYDNVCRPKELLNDEKSVQSG
jgi:hypothetical protein